jgi:uncharacterized membrane protein YqgA involved in biofilm formation
MSPTRSRVPLTARINPADPDSPWVLSYFAQRRIAGWIGIALPIAVFLITKLIDCDHHVPPSISDSYYTLARNYFVGSLCAVGIFMIAGVGYDEDRLLSFFAGAMAFLVAFSPCNGVNVACLPILLQTGKLHIVAAVLLFLDFAWMCIFRFTRTQGQKAPSQSPHTLTPKKRVRNNVYRVCGGLMVAAMAIEAAAWLFPSSALGQVGHLTFGVEAVCLFSFGFAWLVKGQQLFADANTNP